MWFVQLVRFLASWPLQALGVLVIAVAKHPAGAALWRAAWRVSGDGLVALRAFAAIRQVQGIAQAKEFACQAAQRHRCVELAVLVGLYALEDDQIDLAGQWLAYAKSLGKDRQGLLELLEFHLAMKGRPMAECAEIAEQLRQRTDVSPTVKLAAHEELAWQAVLRRDFGRAKALAGHVLSVGDNFSLGMAAWAAHTATGDRRPAEAFLGSAKEIVPGHRLAFEVRADYAMGDRQAMAEKMERLAEINPPLAQQTLRMLDELEGVR